MKNVSSKFKEVIKNGGPFFAYAEVTLADGTILTLDSEKDFCIEGNNYSESSGDGFPLGEAISKVIDIGIDNSDGRYSSYDFYYSKIALHTEVDLDDGTVERVKEGMFTVTEPIASGEIIEITASDEMYKADIEYVSKLTYPATTLKILQEACGQCDISLGSVSFENDDFIVQKAPEGYTCRQIFGYVAQIAGGNAVIGSSGELLIKNYSSYGPQVLSGGNFNAYPTNSVDAGEFGTESETILSGGSFDEVSSYHVVSEFSTDPDISTDDVVITGISTSAKEEDEETTILYGEEGYVLAIENPLIDGDEETAITLIGDMLIGLMVRPFSGEFMPDPTIEFMDTLYLVDKNNNTYLTFATDITFNYLGHMSLANDTKSPERNKKKYASQATQSYLKAKKEISENKTAWKEAAAKLLVNINDIQGSYTTVVTDEETGASITYTHNKPELEESDIIWKENATARAVSTDGGKTWNSGVTADGDAIYRILTTIGVNADWINTGSITVKDGEGNIIFSVDMSTGKMIVQSDNFNLDADGNLSISGKYEVEYTRTYTSSDFTQDDADRVTEIVTEDIEATEDDLKKYDLKGTGIDTWCRLAINRLVAGTDTWRKIKYKITIDPTESTSVIKTTLTHWSSSNTTEYELGSVKIGGAGIKATEMMADTMNAKSYQTSVDGTIYTGATNTFTSADGKTVTVVNGIITSIT